MAAAAVELYGLEPLRMEDEALILVDQCLLPQKLQETTIASVQELIDAICRLSVRGAPALGLAGAYGLVLACRESTGHSNFKEAVEKHALRIRSARPTAVNLSAAVDAGMQHLRLIPDALQWLDAARDFALKWHKRDQQYCRAICEHALPLIEERGGIWLTLCNAGPLATSGVGTAQGALIHAHRQGALTEVLACETRPLLQGARLTVWELMRADVPCRLISDSMAAAAMAELDVRGVIIGADRIATNGDTANKVGSYALALAAQFHEIPLLVAAPTTTLDLNCRTGADIPIEQRSAEELRGFMGVEWSAANCDCWNPAFDRVPANLIEAIITENGVFRSLYKFNKEAISA